MFLKRSRGWPLVARAFLRCRSYCRRVNLNWRHVLTSGCFVFLGLLGMVNLAGCSMIKNSTAQQTQPGLQQPKLSASYLDLAANKRAIADGSFQMTGLVGMIFVRGSDFGHVMRAIARFEIDRDKRCWAFTIEKPRGIIAARLAKTAPNLYILSRLGRPAEQYNSAATMYLAHPWTQIIDDEVIGLLQNAYDAKQFKQKTGCCMVYPPKRSSLVAAKVFYGRYSELAASIPHRIYMRFVDLEIDLVVTRIKSQCGNMDFKRSAATLAQHARMFGAR